MKITSFDHGLDLAKATKGYIRTPGLHMSDLYGRYYEIYDKNRYAEKGVGPDKLRMEMGTSFEEVLEPVLAQRLLGERPGEFTTPEGIIFSPDYLFYEGKKTILGEFKLTWMSSRDAPMGKKFARWRTQIMLYCHALNINVARLYVLFVNDDYAPPKPALLSWEIRFTDEELAEEWRIIMDNAYAEGLFDGKDVVKSQQHSRVGDTRKTPPRHRKDIRRSRHR